MYCGLFHVLIGTLTPSQPAADSQDRGDAPAGRPAPQSPEKATGRY